ncbi:MAG: CapA family protein [Proteobacteria bacterium]|jgi:poly-gamma-glutamate capsule biosynthesis protein CapA/YwtB (metallophosphatase superfamily)|nr:CapA family protein [Pseudomonadota bacterium]MBK9253620.1 CapA family protein [Pseudomonadota bacterium]MCC6630501.1 CapA family protein [Gammaproteobacteria bacterium]
MIEQTHIRTQSPDALMVLLTGDMVLDVPGADHWLSGIAPALRSADLTVAHLEVPHTRRGSELAGDVPAPGADPDNLDALARAGVGMVSLAGNHIADCGVQGIADTVDRLERLGIAHTGAGATLAEASRAAVIERRGRRVALLSYNCVGPEAGWAAPDRAGCNFLRMQAADGKPVSPNSPLVAPTTEALEQLRADITGARARADLVIVALHKGIVHTPAKLAPYERPLAEAALDAGADIVVGHHAHIVRGVEMRAGKALFHGLGNGCVVTHALSPSQDHPARAAWAKKRRELFGFEPDPRYELAPFHPEAVNAVIGVVRVEADGGLRMGVIPVHVEPPGRPVCVNDARAEEVIAYLDRIGAMAGLPPRQWRREGPWLWMCT